MNQEHDQQHKSVKRLTDEVQSLKNSLCDEQVGRQELVQLETNALKEVAHQQEVIEALKLQLETQSNAQKEFEQLLFTKETELSAMKRDHERELEALKAVHIENPLHCETSQNDESPGMDHNLDSPIVIDDSDDDDSSTSDTEYLPSSPLSGEPLAGTFMAIIQGF